MLCVRDTQAKQHPTLNGNQSPVVEGVDWVELLDAVVLVAIPAQVEDELQAHGRADRNHRRPPGDHRACASFSVNEC